MKSLWGEEFDLESEKELAEKVKKKKETKKELSTEKRIKKAKVPFELKMKMIYDEVMRILGVYKDRTKVVTDINEFAEYIDAANKAGVIAIDTETNNSLDTMTCLIMGLCLYVPGEKQVYIPVNHTNTSGEKLPNQITERQIYEQLSRLNQDTKNIFHNGKFDFEVIYNTCGIKLPIYWDTMIGAKVLNENESASLKWQYIDKIDSSIEKYSIENLFEKEQYAIFPPELFALYAATDAFMTYELYKWQLKQFMKPDNKRIYEEIFMNTEMPIVRVSAEMELFGAGVDKKFAERLQAKYEKKNDENIAVIEAELDKLKPQIDAWRQTEEANKRSTVESADGIKQSKSKSEQLSNPPVITSPTQLAILLYDILGAPVVNKKKPRSTGAEDLKKLNDKMHLPLLDALMVQKKNEKLLTSFLRPLPKLLSPRDNRIHCSLNQYGAATGRFSCSDPNLQQIPSKNKEIRSLFLANTVYNELISDNNFFCVKYSDEVEITGGAQWKFAKDIVVGDVLACDDGPTVVKDIKVIGNKYYIYY